MDFDFDWEKTKEVPYFLAQNAFWAALVLIAAAILIGVLLGYKYVYLVEQSSAEPSNLIQLNQNKLQQVLNRVEERKSKFKRLEKPTFNLFRAD